MERLWRYARRRRRGLLWGCVVLVLTNATAMTIPQLFRIAIDGIEHGSSVEDLRSVAIAFLTVAFGGACFRILSRVHLFYAGRDVEYDIRNDFYEHLTTQPPSFFAAQPTGDLMSRATNDLTQVRMMLGPGILNLVNTFVAFATAVPLMVLISGKLTAISLAIYVPSLILVQQLSRRLYQRNRQQQKEMGRMSNFIQENLAGAHVVRAFNMERHQADGFEAINQDYYRAMVRLIYTRSYMWRLLAVFASLGVLLAIFVGAGDVMAGRITIGELVAVVEYLGLLAWPSFALGWALSLYQRGTSAWGRLLQIFDTVPAIRPGSVTPDHLRPAIRIRDLSIDMDGRRVVDGVSLEIPEGTTLGIVGPIGSGKTLLVHALVRQVGADPGTIFIGEHDITTLDHGALRGAFGFVHQNPLLFSKTIAENVAFGKPRAERAEIHAALRGAAFDKDLKMLPQGIDTPVGERGITLSGGQKQRTAIARAMLLDPPILVLDDALSSVDAETEVAILSHLREVRRRRTTIIVAHRVSAVQHADQIIVLDRGSIVERGDHESLTTHDGLYAKMVRRQKFERDLSDLQSTTRESA